MSETRYAQVARDLAEGISSGRFAVGSLLPTEFELCDIYGASRHTIRSAIQELQDLGLVSRRKKIGTRVEAASPRRGYRQTLASLEDLVQFGAAHTRVVQEIADVVTDRTLAKQLGCATGRSWLRISSLRLNGEAGAAPVGWTDVYLDSAYAELRETVRDKPDVLISTLIEDRFGRQVAEVRQDVQAVVLKGRLASRLDAPVGTPALRIARHYLDRAGEVFEISISVHPADRFRFSMHLKRDRA